MNCDSCEKKIDLGEPYLVIYKRLGGQPSMRPPLMGNKRTCLDCAMRMIEDLKSKWAAQVKAK